jgi:trehalose 6-phosphate synthase/phosphatase
VAQYQLLQKQIDGLVGRINGKYGTAEWTPVRYFSHFLPFGTLIAFYSIADVALVTPFRDGMNLMAKEFIASKTNGQGTLILSEMTGAAQELGEALIVNPNNQEELVAAIDKALKMPLEEQQLRNRIMQNRLRRYDINRWVADFLNRLDCAWLAQQTNTQHLLTASLQKQLIASYVGSTKRLILLDYDGTLVPFADKPEKAVPTQQVLDILTLLSALPSNQVVITSGRSRNTLTEWFGALNVGLIAEHGAWIKKQSGELQMPALLSYEWKKDLLPLLELYTDRTPGSFIEEKPDSIVWHYRKTDPLLASVRAKELKDDLMHLTYNQGLAVAEGNKIIEIKNAIVNKGRAASNFLSENNWDFILALGDDKTDEDLFSVLSASAYSIKVGLGPSKARYNLASQRDVLPLLNKLTKEVTLIEIKGK